MVYTYATFLAIILICEIGAGIAAFALKGDLRPIVEEKMMDGMKNYSKLLMFGCFFNVKILVCLRCFSSIC